MFDDMDKKLIAEVDCTRRPDPGMYFEKGQTAVVRSGAGTYREAAPEPLSRFGYRFRVEHPGRPHLLIVDTPDDKRRYMCITDGTCYDLDTGILTGGIYPLSGRMLQVENLFWPRWNDCSVVFTSWGENESAAVGGFRVYELGDLPASQGNSAAQGRTFGIQYEDPCGCGFSVGAHNETEWLHRHIEYMKLTGQNLLIYPMVWYHGPLFPCFSQPSTCFSAYAADDRTQYARSTVHPGDFIAGFLESLGRENMAFVGSMTLLRLGNLLRNMNVDLESIRAGAETYNNMRADNRVQYTCGDWTTEYNALIREEMTRYRNEHGSLSGFDFAYGEKHGGISAGPMFNPLHPQVQKQVIEFIAEAARRYAGYPAFKGIYINMWHATMLWFGSLESGYDDYTAALFERETGIQLGAQGPERFAARYQILTGQNREQWITWRCERVLDFMRKIRDAVKSADSRLVFGLTFWNETSCGVKGGIKAQNQWGARPSDFELYREAGADLALLGREEGIEIAVENNHQRDRSSHGMNFEGVEADKSHMFHDHDFLDEKRAYALLYSRAPNAFVFNCWVEHWGKRTSVPVSADDPNLRDGNLPLITGVPAEFIARENSEYAADGFWFDSQLNITAAFPKAEYYMQYFAYSLARYDALRITSGGLYLDTAHAGATQAFAREFTCIPPVSFEPVGANDPVAVRQQVYDGKQYFYAVNAAVFPVEVTITFNTKTVRICRVSDNETIEVHRALRLALPPCGLAVFTAPAGAAVAGFQTKVPDDVLSTLRRQAQKQIEVLESAAKAGGAHPMMAKTRDDIQAALDGGEFVRLSNLLCCYWSAKANETAASSSLWL